MLDPEHFFAIERSVRNAGSGFLVPSEARRWLSIAPIDTDGTKAIHLRESDRYYRLTDSGGSVCIEGFVSPPSEKRPKKIKHPLANHMIPLAITEVGTIFSAEGERISPHNERLRLLAHDLKRGEAISQDEYYREMGEVDYYR